MRITEIASAAVLLLLGGCTGHHAEPKSGVPESSIRESSILQSGFPVGGRMPKYLATKVAGGEDGIKLGRSLCYTWVLGARPVVFIVARTPDRALTMLVKTMDDLVVLQQGKKLAAVVNFLGEINDETKEKIKEFDKELDLKKVPLAVTTDAEPLKINDAAEVTVMIYRGKTVKANYALAKDRLDQKTIEAIINSTESMLNEPGA